MVFKFLTYSYIFFDALVGAIFAFSRHDLFGRIRKMAKMTLTDYTAVKNSTKNYIKKMKTSNTFEHFK